MVSFASAGLFDPGSEIEFHEEGKNGKYGYYEINDTDFWFFNNKPVKTIELIENDYSVLTAWNIKEIEVFKPTKLFDTTNYLDKEQEKDRKSLLSSELHLFREWEAKTRTINNQSCFTYGVTANLTEVCLEWQNNPYEENYEGWSDWEVYNFQSVQEGLYQTKTIVTRSRQGTGIIDWVDENEGWDLDEWATWWDNDWNKKRLISSLDGNMSGLYSITFDSDMNVDFSDLRFLDNDTESIELNYTFSNKTNSTFAQVRVDNLGETQIYMYYNNPAVTTTENASNLYFNPISAWFFDQNALDFVGSSDGTINNGPTIIPGYINGSFSFDGVNQDINTSLGFPTNAWSVSVWTFQTSQADFSAVLAATSLAPWIGIGTSGSVRVHTAAASSRADTDTTPLTTNQWEHLAVTYDGAGTMHIYVNAVDIAFTVSGSLINSTGNNLWIASNVGGGNFFDGDLDEMYLYDKVLTQDQVTRLFTQTEPNFTVGAEETNLGVATTLLSPEDNSNFTTTLIQFNFTSIPTQVNLTNATLYLWNATDNTILLTNFTTLSGNESVNTTFQNNLSEGDYLWNAQTCGVGIDCKNATTNNSFILHFTEPTVNITAPSGVLDFLLLGDNETLIYNISEPGENLTEHLVDCWFVYGDVRDSFETGNDGWLPSSLNRTQAWSTDGNWSASLEGILLEQMFKNITATRIIFDYHEVSGESDLQVLENGVSIFVADGSVNDTSLDINGSSNITFRLINGISIPTYYIDNIRYETPINCSANTTTFPYQEGVNNISVFALDSFGLIGNDTSSWEYSVLEISQTFNNETIEGITEEFLATITTNLAVSSATLIYNGASFIGTLNQTSINNFIINASIVIPSVSADENITFFWQIVLSSGETFNLTSHNQTVFNIAIDDCGSGTILIMNYSLFEEQSQNILNGTIEVDLELLSTDGTVISNFSNDYVNKTNAEICINNVSGATIDYLVSVVVGYTATNFAEEFHNIQMGTLDNSTIPINISLFDLAIADSTTFAMSYKGLDFLPLVGSLFNVQRKYISEGVFKSIEIVESDDEGFAKAHFDTEGVIYRITITQNGSVIDSFDNVKVLCDNIITEDCNINLNSFSSATDFTTWNQFGDVTFEMSFDSDTRTNTVSFNTVDGTPINMTISAVTVDGSSTQLCSSSLFSSAGVITCVVPESFGNLTIISTLSTNDINILSRADVISSDPIDAFGVDAFVFGFILVISFPLIMVGSPIGVMFGLVFGVLAAFMLLLADNSGLLGPASAFTWFLVAGAILIYKMFRRER